MRGKEGAGLSGCLKRSSKTQVRPVSVPLRGKEGAGRDSEGRIQVVIKAVSVPLRGKEGAGPLVFGNLI